MTARLTFLDFNRHWTHDIGPLKQVDSFGGSNTTLRVGVVAVVIYVLLNQQAPVALARDFTLYAGLTILQTIVVTRLPVVIGRRGATLLFLTCFGIGMAWTVGLLHLWMQEDEILRMMGLLGLLWWLIHAVTARRNDSVMMAATLLAMSVALSALPLVSWLVLGDPREALLLSVTNLGGFFSFYVTGIRDVRIMRRSLLQAQTLAFEQSKTEALGRLTGGVAHDFNNLLTVISGNVELMRHIDDPVERVTLLEEAAAAATRAAIVTAQLLAYSRRAPMHPTRVVVDESLAELDMLLKRLLSARIAYRTVLHSPSPLLQVDKSQFDTVLLNLVINARDAMPSGGNITLRAMPEHVTGPVYRTSAGVLSEGVYLRIEVDDDGLGMSPEVLARVFEPYFTTKPKGQGTGMGLSMAFGFAAQSGGLLTLQSAEGLGTIATLLLPAAEVAAA
ncbi:sensor histidine kinase [Loktanella sp. DJP18]|uniref:sensor histidine kinase n=1 Tax=Loktanella sp. DJP18 TaxID=3409788 RepID=UPI003BB69DA6